MNQINTRSGYELMLLIKAFNFFLVLLLFGSPTLAQTTTIKTASLKQVANPGPLSRTALTTRLNKSVAILTTEIGTGTGFMIGGGYMLTAAHVVTKTANKITVTMNGARVQLGCSLATPANDNSDWALLRLSGRELSKLVYEPLPVASYRPVEGSFIAMYGGSTSLAFATGKILDASGGLLVTGQLPCRPGDSGSPLVDTCGNVIGLLSANSNDGVCISVDITRYTGFLSDVPGIRIISKNPVRSTTVVATNPPATVNTTPAVANENTIASLKNERVVLSTNFISYFISSNTILSCAHFLNKGDSIRFSLSFQNNGISKTYTARKIMVEEVAGLCLFKLETTDRFSFVSLPDTIPASSNVFPAFTLEGIAMPAVKNCTATTGYQVESLPYFLGALNCSTPVENWAFDNTGKIIGLTVSDENNQSVFIELKQFRNRITSLLTAN